MSYLAIRVIGTICIVDPKKNDDPFKKRAVIPYDKYFSAPVDKHIAYVEFNKNDLASGSGLSNVYKRGKGDVEYRRFNLDGHVIQIDQIVDTSFEVTGSYDKHIPKMTNVLGTLDVHPRTECFDAKPDPTLIAGFFDISKGLLKAGPLYESITQFEVKSGDVVFVHHSAIFTELLLQVQPPITVSFTKDNITTAIVLKDDADLITIGNLPETEISGDGGGDDIKHHFMINYKLADPFNEPTDPPLPRKFALVVNACTNTNWP